MKTKELPLGHARKIIKRRTEIDEVLGIKLNKIPLIMEDPISAVAIQAQNTKIHKKNIDTINPTNATLKTIKDNLNTSNYPSYPLMQNNDVEENNYTNDDHGALFAVMMEAENLNEISVGKLLFNLGIKEISEVRKAGKDRVKVTLLNKKVANSIINNPNISKLHRIKAYIPNSFIKTTGIVKNVPLDLSDDELLESARVHGNVKINKLERMKFFDKEDNKVKESYTIKIEFRSTTLPKEIILYHVKKEVQPFIPKPTICRKCLRYGHVAAICKSTKFSCFNCTEEIHPLDKNCTCSHCEKECIPKCKNCNSHQHNSMSSSCPVMKIQQNIKKEMITNNLTYILAKQKIDNQSTGETYASVSNFSTQIKALKEENTNLKRVNELLMERISTIDKFMETITNTANNSNISSVSNASTSNTSNINNELCVENLIVHKNEIAQIVKNYKSKINRKAHIPSTSTDETNSTMELYTNTDPPRRNS